MQGLEEKGGVMALWVSPLRRDALICIRLCDSLKDETLLNHAFSEPNTVQGGRLRAY